jgi:hypothetical protein
VYSRRDGIVDWSYCLDPLATAVEIRCSHLEMVLDPRAIRVVADVVTARDRA